MTDTAIDPEPYHVYAARDGVRLPWHAGENGRRWWQALGLMLDGIMNGAQAAVASRWVSKCPPDVLRVHGESFGMPQAPSETDEEYRLRLKKVWRLCELRGTAAGIVYALSLVGMTNVEVKEAFTAGWGRHKSGASIDIKKTRWFNVVIRQPHPFGTDFGFRYGDGTTYGGGALYGVNGDKRWVEIVKHIVRNMKPAHAHCEAVIVVLAGNITTGTGTTSDGNPASSSDRVAYLYP